MKRVLICSESMSSLDGVISGESGSAPWSKVVN